MLLGGGIIKSAVAKRGFKHRRTEDQFSVRGEYARTLQYVYSREHTTSAGLVVDLLYFAVDILNEKLVIGLYRENPEVENGVYNNTTQSIDLKKWNAEELDRVLDKMILRLKDGFK